MNGGNGTAPEVPPRPGPAAVRRDPIQDWRASTAAERPGRRRLYIGIVIAVAVGAVLAVVLGESVWGSPGASCNPSIPSPWTSGRSAVLEKCGTRFVVPAHSYVGYSAERYSDAQILLGRFSSGTPVGTYLLNSTQFTAVVANPYATAPPANYSWTCGVVALCNLHAIVPPSPSEYFLTFENFNGTNASVVWSLSLVVAYIPTND